MEQQFAEEKCRKIPLKLFDAHRSVRKGVVVSTFDQLTEKCKQKFNIPSNNTITIVLDEDGVEVDEDYFTVLQPNTAIMVLHGDEMWNPLADEEFSWTNRMSGINDISWTNQMSG